MQRKSSIQCDRKLYRVSCCSCYCCRCHWHCHSFTAKATDYEPFGDWRQHQRISGLKGTSLLTCNIDVIILSSIHTKWVALNAYVCVYMFVCICVSINVFAFSSQYILRHLWIQISQHRVEKIVGAHCVHVYTQNGITFLKMLHAAELIHLQCNTRTVIRIRSHRNEMKVNQ